MIKWCGKCEEDCNAHIELRTETYHIVDEDVLLENVSVVVCDKCGNDIWDGDIDDATLIRAYHKYNQSHIDDPITSVFTGKVW